VELQVIYVISLKELTAITLMHASLACLVEKHNLLGLHWNHWIMKDNLHWVENKSQKQLKVKSFINTGETNQQL